MEKSIKYIVLFFVIAACSSQSDFGAIQTSNSSNLEENSTASENPELLGGEEDVEEEEEIIAVPPSVISGAYLSCVMDSQDLEIACQVKDQNDQLLDPTLVKLNASLVGPKNKDSVVLESLEVRANAFIFKLEELSLELNIVFTLENAKGEAFPQTYEVNGETILESEGKPLIILETIDTLRQEQMEPNGESYIEPEPTKEEVADNLESDLPQPPVDELTFSNVSKNAQGNYRILLIQNESNSASVNRVLETTKLADYIDELNADNILGLTLEIETVVQAEFDIESAKSAALAIWMDHSYQIGGLSDSTVDIFASLYESGVPLYFIGDDIAYSINQNLSQEKQAQFSQLCHLEASSNNGSSPVGIEVGVTEHPSINGPYGLVANFAYNLDPDEEVQATGSGEEVLATRTGGSVALLSYEGDQDKPPVMTQTFLILGGTQNDAIALEQRKTLFKNSLYWFLNPLVEPQGSP